MKRLLFLALVAFAAWYGWHHYADLKQAGAHEIVVANRTGHTIERLRISVGEKTIVVETLENGAQTRQPFRCDRDGPFALAWQLRDVMGDKQWSGGQFSHGPILLSYRFEFHPGDGVIVSSERLATK